uniref:Uncharacterized protein n=1 Tax=Ananas comosus var. bracteatus TaxID=296719 RepID=A0A6V7NSF9_ANACO|nr:unnamed protein product [Ananas comosus var. bracteatus]
MGERLDGLSTGSSHHAPHLITRSTWKTRRLGAPQYLTDLVQARGSWHVPMQSPNLTYLSLARLSIPSHPYGCPSPVHAHRRHLIAAVVAVIHSRLHSIEIDLLGGAETE